MDGSTPGLPVHHQLPELAQTQVRQVSAVHQTHQASTGSLEMGSRPPELCLCQGGTAGQVKRAGLSGTCVFECVALCLSNVTLPRWGSWGLRTPVTEVAEKEA